MLNWYYVTKAQYTAAATHSSDNLYFLSDTKEIYRGDDLFTQSVIMYTGELPSRAPHGARGLKCRYPGSPRCGTSGSTRQCCGRSCPAGSASADGFSCRSGKLTIRSLLLVYHRF